MIVASVVVGAAASYLTNLVTSPGVGATVFLLWVCLVIVGAVLAWMSTRPEPGETRIEANNSLSAPTPPKKVVGRDALLAELIGLLSVPDGDVHVVAGLAGTGKTTVAAKLAEEARRKGLACWWIDLRGAKIMDALAQVGSSLGILDADIRNALNKNNLADLVWRALEDRAGKGWLLVVDNADSPKHLHPDGVQVIRGNAVIRPSRSGLVVVTSRDSSQQVWGDHAKLHRLEALTAAEGAQMLLENAKRTDLGGAQQAQALAEQLGGLPLNLNFASRLLNGVGGAGLHKGGQALTFESLKAQLTQNTSTLDQAAPSEQMTLRNIYEFTFEQLAEEGKPEARWIMRLVAAMSPAPIPLDILTPKELDTSPLFKELRGLGQKLGRFVKLGAGTAGRDRHIEDVLSRLSDFMYLAPTQIPGYVAAHRLVWELNRSALESDKDVRRAAVVTAARCLHKAADEHRRGERGDEQWWLSISPHLAELLNERGHGEVENLATLANATVEVLLRNRYIDAAQDLSKRAIEGLTQSGYAESSALFRTTRERLVEALMAGHRLAEAEAELKILAKPASGLFNAAGKKNQLAAESDLAYVVRRDGRYAEAVEKYEGVWRQNGSVYGKNAPQTTMAMHSYGHALLLAGEISRAVEELSACQELAHRFNSGLPENFMAKLKVSLGRAHHHLGAFDRAASELSDALPYFEQADGLTKHVVRYHLARALDRYGETQRAFTLFDLVVAEAGKLEPGQNDQVAEIISVKCCAAFALHRKGNDLKAQGEFKKLANAQTKYLQLREDHPERLRVRYGLASALYGNWTYDEALPIFTDVLKRQQDCLGQAHPDTLATEFGYAGTLYGLKQYDKAAEKFGRLQRTLAETFSAEHPDAVSAQLGLDSAKNRPVWGRGQIRNLHRVISP